jgi:hypothetical protein
MQVFTHRPITVVWGEVGGPLSVFFTFSFHKDYKTMHNREALSVT